MKKQINRLCILAGIGFLALAVVVMALWQWNMDASQKNAAHYVQTIFSLIPDPQSAPLEERRDNTMSVLPVEGKNFLGVLEMPRYGSSLPVCADWGEVSQYPCRLSGSVYDRTIQIGGTSQKGQYDFYREISVGDAVFLTDMEGNRFSYQVTDIRYAQHTNQETLHQQEAALTLFIKNIYSFDYILIFCNPVG